VRKDVGQNRLPGRELRVVIDVVDNTDGLPGVHTFSTLLILWRTWQLAQSLSHRTVDERCAAVRRMAKWCKVTPDRATVEDVANWLAAGGDWQARTRWTYHADLSAWFLWLQKQGHRVDNPMIMIGKPRRPKCTPRPISSRDLTKLLNIRMHRRTRAMILLAAFAGLRVHEIAKLRAEHLDLIDRRITVTGKGGTTCTLPLHHLVVEHAYKMPRTGWWFPGVDNGHQSRTSVGHTIKQAMVRAGVAGSAHQLRHWFGSELVDTGTDLRTTQELMRHATLNSTEIYTHVTSKRRIEGIDRLDPCRGVA
jgi:site-specific recombinase XerD